MAGCRSVQYVPVERTEHTHDTLLIVQQRIDTAHVRDSIYVHTYTRGDTVYATQYKERTRYRLQQHTDTVRIVQSDTVRVPQVVEVEKKPSRWQRAKDKAAGAGAGIVAGLIGGWWLRRKFAK